MKEWLRIGLQASVRRRALRVALVAGSIRELERPRTVDPAETEKEARSV